MAENGCRRRNGSARRRLFPASENREQDMKDLDDLVRKEEAASALAFEKRWNFRVQDEAPVPGRYEWEKISNDQSKPSTSVSHLPLSSKQSNETGNSDTQTDLTIKTRESLSATVSDDNNSEPSSLSGDETDVNANIVPNAVKRKASPPLSKEETSLEAKRVKPP